MSKQSSSDSYGINVAHQADSDFSKPSLIQFSESDSEGSDAQSQAWDEEKEYQKSKTPLWKQKGKWNTDQITKNDWGKIGSINDIAWESLSIPITSFKSTVINTPKSARIICWEQNFKKLICPHGVWFYSPKDDCGWCNAETMEPVTTTKVQPEASHPPSPTPSTSSASSKNSSWFEVTMEDDEIDFKNEPHHHGNHFALMVSEKSKRNATNVTMMKEHHIKPALKKSRMKTPNHIGNSLKKNPAIMINKRNAANSRLTTWNN